MGREEIAVEKRNKGFNCAQAVACTYADYVDMSEEDLFRATEALGGGLGCTLGTCGALNAACILAGVKTSTANLEKPNSKADTYKITRQMVKSFEEQAGAVQCCVLKGIGTGKVLCECPDCVRIACRLVEEHLG